MHIENDSFTETKDTIVKQFLKKMRCNIKNQYACIIELEVSPFYFIIVSLVTSSILSYSKIINNVY